MGFSVFFPTHKIAQTPDQGGAHGALFFAMIKLDPKWGDTADSFFQRIIETENRRLRERYMALAMIASGHNLLQVAAQIKRRRQTIADWIHRYNKLGIDGLRLEFQSKVVPALTEAEFNALRTVIARPPKESGFPGTHWRSRQVAEYIERAFGKRVHSETARRYLHRLKSRHNNRLKRRDNKSDVSAVQAGGEGTATGLPGNGGDAGVADGVKASAEA